MIFINYHLIKLELRHYHPDMEFGADVLRRFYKVVINKM